MLAHIYSPAKNAMQSGKARDGVWVLRFDPNCAKMIEPLMGYTSSTDMNGQVCLKFPDKEKAVAFAEKHGLAYYITQKPKAPVIKVSYADNFAPTRQQPWTH